MPLYDFICKSCNQEFEILVMGKDLPQCPDCGSTELEKQVSSFAIGRGSKSSPGSSGSGSSSSGCGGCSGGNCSSCH